MSMEYLKETISVDGKFDILLCNKNKLLISTDGMIPLCICNHMYIDVIAINIYPYTNTLK